MESLTALVFGYVLTIVICNTESCEIIKDPKIFDNEKDCWRQGYILSLIVDEAVLTKESKVYPKVMDVSCKFAEFDKG